MPYAPINVSASGDSTIVSAVANRRIRIQNYLLLAGGTVTATWKSGSTAISGPLPLTTAVAPCPTNGGSYANGPGGVLETNGGDPLVLNLSGAVQVSGHIRYEVVC